MITWQSFSIWPSASEEMVSARTTSTSAASEAAAHLQQFNEDTYWDTLGIMESAAASIPPEQLYHYTFVSFHRTRGILAPFLPSLNHITVKQELGPGIGPAHRQDQHSQLRNGLEIHNPL